MSDRTSRKAEQEARWRASHPDYGREYMRSWYPHGDPSRPVGTLALTPAQVRAIRRDLAAGKRRRDLACEYGVAYNTIRRIDAGMTYLEQEYQA